MRILHNVLLRLRTTDYSMDVERPILVRSLKAETFVNNVLI